MNVASVTAVRLVQSFGDRRAQIEAALALGASPRQCTASVMRRPVRLAKVPLVDSTKTMPIVFLPCAMTGMILAGADPHAGGRRVHAAGGGLAGPLSSSRGPPGAGSRRRCSCGGWRPDEALVGQTYAGPHCAAGQFCELLPRRS